MTAPEDRFRPVTRSTTHWYVPPLSLEQLGANLGTLARQGARHFARPPDHAEWEVVSEDGRQSGRVPMDDASALVGECDGRTSQFSVRISRIEGTSPAGYEWTSEEHLSIGVEFDRHILTVWSKVARAEDAKALSAMALEGLRLMSVYLPPEHIYLESSVRRLLEEHPVIENNVFLAMRFRREKPFPEVVTAIRTTCERHGLTVLRADDRAYSDDLWPNVMTYMYACGSAVAVFDQVNYREFNPNVALEVGFLLAQRKPVLLLKDRAIQAMYSDLVGKIYRPFNTDEPAETIPSEVETWLRDNRLGTSDGR